MKPMTPEDAQIVLVGAKEHGGHLSIGYRRALETIAGMHEEWGVEERHEYTGEWAWHSTYPDRESACDAANGMTHFRIARRYVTEPEVTE